MKALAASCALVIALLSVAKPAGAHPIYKGTLLADRPYDLDFDHATVNAKSIVTVYYLTGGKPATAEREARLGKGSKFDILTIPANARLSFVQEIPKGTRLVVIDIASAANTSFDCNINQVGGSSFPDICGGGNTFTFDVE